MCKTLSGWLILYSVENFSLEWQFWGSDVQNTVKCHFWSAQFVATGIFLQLLSTWASCFDHQREGLCDRLSGFDDGLHIFTGLIFTQKVCFLNSVQKLKSLKTRSFILTFGFDLLYCWTRHIVRRLVPFMKDIHSWLKYSLLLF